VRKSNIEGFAGITGQYSGNIHEPLIFCKNDNISFIAINQITINQAITFTGSNNCL